MKNTGIDVLLTQRVETALGVLLGQARDMRVRSTARDVSEPGDVPRTDETHSASGRAGDTERALADVRAGGPAQTQARSAGSTLVARSGRDPAGPAGREFIPAGAVDADAELSVQVHLTPDGAALARASAATASIGRAAAQPPAEIRTDTPASAPAALLADEAGRARQAVAPLLDGRNPALATLARSQDIPQPVRDVLILLVDAMLSSGLFQTSLLADAHAGRLAYEKLSSYLSAATAANRQDGRTDSAANRPIPGAGVQDLQPGTGSASSADTALPAAGNASGRPASGTSTSVQTVSQVAAQTGAETGTQAPQVLPGGTPGAALEALYSQSMTFQIPLFPGAPPATLVFARQEKPKDGASNDGANHAAPRNQAPRGASGWHCTLEIDLPRLGPIQAAFSADHNDVSVDIRAAREPTMLTLQVALAHGALKSDRAVRVTSVSRWEWAPRPVPMGDGESGATNAGSAPRET
ncbi:MAG: hypothetical protein EPN41_07750 [Candidimonas sp.]|nr:MAG: hypothetical protein EPN41_07750 [Candidimonas sp.]